MSINLKMMSSGDISGKTSAFSLGLYKEDQNKDKAQYKQNAITSPGVASLRNVGSNIDDSGHIYQYASIFKTCDLLLGGNGKERIDNTNWGNWRKVNGITFVPASVWLQSDSKEMSLGFTHEFGNALDDLKSKGYISKLSSAMEVARLSQSSKGEALTNGGQYISKYKMVPYYKSSTALQLTSGLSFKFKFGQAGLFSGEYEVVRPILALANYFALGSVSDSNYIIGPVPTYPMYLFNFMAKVTDEIGSSINNLIKTDKDKDKKNTLSGEGLIKSLTNLENSLYANIDNAIEGTLNLDSNNTVDARIKQNGQKFNIKKFTVRFGRLISGPYLAKDIKFTFDNTNLDEYGFPCAGSITLGSIESITMPTVDTFMNMANGSAVSPMTSEEEERASGVHQG